MVSTFLSRRFIALGRRRFNSEGRRFEKWDSFISCSNVLGFGILSQRLSVQNVGKHIGVIGMATISQVAAFISAIPVHLKARRFNMKRGIRARLDGGWAGAGILAIILMLLGFISGCSHISLKAPTTQILIKDATFLAGYEIGKANLTLAAEFIKHTQIDREDILTLYPSWKRYLAYRLEDPVHRRLVGTMLALVEIDLQLKIPVEQEKVIRELFREFIVGLEAGIDANR